MHTRLAEFRADRVLFERVKTGLLSRHREPPAGEESEERVLHALGRIFRERFVQDPRVVSIDVKRELLLFFQSRDILFRDRIDDGLERLHIGGVAFPLGVFYAAGRDVFAEQPVVSVHPTIGRRSRGHDEEKSRPTENARK